MRDEQLEWVKAGLAALPARDREVLVMRYVGSCLVHWRSPRRWGTTEAGAKTGSIERSMRLRNQMEGSE